MLCQNECRAAVVGLCDFFAAKLRREPFLQAGAAAAASAESTLHVWCVNHSGLARLQQV